MELLDHRDLRAQQVPKDLKVAQVILDHRDRRDQQEILDPKAHKDPAVLQLQAQPDHKDLRV